MFGYLTPEKGELRVREYEVYRAHYCGVCFSLRKRCSLISCATLTYDSAFLSVLGASLAPLVPVACSHCPFKPYKRVNVSKGEWADYAADANALLSKKKCEDDKRDDHPVRRCALGALALGKACRRAVPRLLPVLPAIESGMDRLASLERDGCDSIDEPALAFAQVMEAVFAGIPGQKSAREPLLWMGKNIGRWVYLLDAWDDLEKDEKRGNYNVLIRKLAPPRGEAAKGASGIQPASLAGRGLDGAPLLPEGPLTPIVENTLVDGAALRTRKLLAKYDPAQCSKNEEHGTIAASEAVCRRADTQEET